MLHEYLLPHFKDAIMEGGAMSVTASYNAIKGVPSNINKVMLNDILRDMWGFKGFIVSDLCWNLAGMQPSAERNVDWVNRMANS